jgi:hypothetical protein
MDKFIENIIEEEFKSKAQQRFFYAQAGKKGKKGKKWAKWAKEFSDKTDYKKIPDTVEKEVDEIVDKHGNIARGKKPPNFNTKGITSNSTTDKVVKTGAGAMGIHGVHGTHTSLRYWAEADMSKSLGYEDTMEDDENFKEAYRHFTKDLGLSHEESMERLEAMGYIPNEKGDKVRLIETPKKFMEEYIESVLSKKNRKDGEIVNKETEKEHKEISQILKRQLTSLKGSLKSHGLDIEDVIEYFQDKLEGEDE